MPPGNGQVFKYINHPLQAATAAGGAISKKISVLSTTITSVLLIATRFYLLRFRPRRCEFRFAADSAAVFPKDDRNRNKSGRDAAEEGASPLDAHTIEHVSGEEGKDGAGEGPEEGICCDGGGGAVGMDVSILLDTRGWNMGVHVQHKVSVDNVIERLEEYG